MGAGCIGSNETVEEVAFQEFCISLGVFFIFIHQGIHACSTYDQREREALIRGMIAVRKRSRPAARDLQLGLCLLLQLGCQAHSICCLLLGLLISKATDAGWGRMDLWQCHVRSLGQLFGLELKERAPDSLWPQVTVLFVTTFSKILWSGGGALDRSAWALFCHSLRGR